MGENEEVLPEEVYVVMYRAGYGAISKDKNTLAADIVDCPSARVAIYKLVREVKVSINVEVE